MDGGGHSRLAPARSVTLWKRSIASIPLSCTSLPPLTAVMCEHPFSLAHFTLLCYIDGLMCHSEIPDNDSLDLLAKPKPKAPVASAAAAAPAPAPATAPSTAAAAAAPAAADSGVIDITPMSGDVFSIAPVPDVRPCAPFLSLSCLDLTSCVGDAQSTAHAAADDDLFALADGRREEPSAATTAASATSAADFAAYIKSERDKHSSASSSLFG
jgi:hypothetical protein